MPSYILFLNLIYHLKCTIIHNLNAFCKKRHSGIQKLLMTIFISFMLRIQYILNFVGVGSEQFSIEPGVVNDSTGFVLTKHILISLGVETMNSLFSYTALLHWLLWLGLTLSWKMLCSRRKDIVKISKWCETFDEGSLYSYFQIFPNPNVSWLCQYRLRQNTRSTSY